MERRQSLYDLALVPGHLRSQGSAGSSDVGSMHRGRRLGKECERWH